MGTTPLPALECRIIVLRVLLRRQWINPETGDVMPDAFIRRPRGDEDGLSVRLNCTAAAAEEGFNRTFGVVSLHVGRVRGLGLDVVADEPEHANIVGVPYQHEDSGRAEWLAGQLAAQARVVTA
jgi:hypothetical protein